VSTLQYESDKFYDVTAVIADAATKTGVIDLGGLELVGFFVPTGFDGTTVSFEAATSAAGTFMPVHNGNGTAYSLTIAANSYVPITNLAYTAGLRYIKLVASSTQSGASTLTLAVRAV
jgi:hypothetical protein